MATAQAAQSAQPPQTKLVPLFLKPVGNAWASVDNAGLFHLNLTTVTEIGCTSEVSIPSDMLAAGGTELWKHLAKQQMLVNEEGKKFIPGGLMAWLSNLIAAQRAQQALPFGWWNVDNTGRHGFTYAGKVFKDDGTIGKTGYGDMVMRHLFTPAGDIKPWYTACKMITDQKRAELEVIVAASFAAPLMAITGEPCALISAWGTQSGGGKSSAVKVGLGVWGNPQRIKENSSTTPKSIMQKLGDLNNLPLMYDDIRDKKGQENVLAVIFGSEGVGPGRLNSAIQQQKRTTWQTIVVMCSNRSFQDHICSVHKQTAAAMYRVFEYGPIKKPADNALGRINALDAARMTQDIESNYGRMGELYAEFLGKNAAYVDQRTMAILRDFQLAVAPRADERFWVALCGTVLAGAEFANKLGCEFNLPELKAFLVEKYMKLRAYVADANVEGGTLDNTESVLTKYLKDNIAHTLYTTGGARSGGTNLVSMLNKPDTAHPKPMHVQWLVDQNLLRISREHLTGYLTKNDIAPQAVLNGLNEHFKATKVRNVIIGGGTPFRVGKEDVMQIPVIPNTSLDNLMRAHGT